MGGTVDRRRIREQEDWAPKELQGDVGSAKLARHEVNMCRAPLCSSPAGLGCRWIVQLYGHVGFRSECEFVILSKLGMSEL